jgi:hypothetical protein
MDGSQLWTMECLSKPKKLTSCDADAKGGTGNERETRPWGRHARRFRSNPMPRYCSLPPLPTPPHGNFSLLGPATVASSSPLLCTALHRQAGRPCWMLRSVLHRNPGQATVRSCPAAIVVLSKLRVRARHCNKSARKKRKQEGMMGKRHGGGGGGGGFTVLRLLGAAKVISVVSPLPLVSWHCDLCKCMCRLQRYTGDSSTANNWHLAVDAVVPPTAGADDLPPPPVPVSSPPSRAPMIGGLGFSSPPCSCSCPRSN